ncbi:hypothetical protein ABW19_dt0201141 [Dactylella cylindrospora]|nr:hypothetical protein ABW19_dt0201141 [Dactylella cylindrospora]
MKYGTRNSKSSPMPNFVFSLTVRIEETAKRLAREALVPLFRKLHGPDVPSSTKYDLALINIAATNMSGGETGMEGGNVAAMFKRYNEVFPEGDWEKKRKFEEIQEVQQPLLGVIDDEEATGDPEEAEISDERGAEKSGEESGEGDLEDGFLSDDDEFSDVGTADEESQEVVCKNCQIRLPLFAIGAHERFHQNMESG